MDPFTIKVIIGVLVVGTLLFLLARAASKPKKCSVCTADTKSLYMSEGKPDIYLCNSHLADKWENDVKASTVDMVIVEPDFEANPLAYLYASVPTLKEWQYSKEAQDNIDSILNTISGKVCTECGEAASVAFFKSEDYPLPMMEDIKATPTYLCKACATKKVRPLIIAAKNEFAEGFYAPRSERGIFHTQEF